MDSFVPSFPPPREPAQSAHRGDGDGRSGGAPTSAPETVGVALTSEPRPRPGGERSPLSSGGEGEIGQGLGQGAAPCPRPRPRCLFTAGARNLQGAMAGSVGSWGERTLPVRSPQAAFGVKCATEGGRQEAAGSPAAWIHPEGCGKGTVARSSAQQLYQQTRVPCW